MSERNSALAAHHRALGSELEDWNGMGAPWSYTSDPCVEHDAVRTAAGLFDVSGLKKVHVRGSDSLAVVDHLITRDMAVIPIGRSAYGPVLNDDGGICDDAIIFHIAENHHLVVHGSGECRARLEESAAGKDVAIEFDDDLHNISLQGPASVDFLDQHTPIDLPALNYFHQEGTTLFDLPVMISRTGFSGERGFELLAAAEHIVPLWEAILENGASRGIMPCSYTSLDKIRVEAALLFFPYDMTAANTPWEVAFGWAVSRKKGDFRGKEALFAREGQEKVNLIGIVADHGDSVDAGADLLVDGRKVGAVTSPVWSHRLNKSLALAHVEPAAAREGTVYALEGETVSCRATAARIPFHDPEKTRTHA
jgi:aminomethyltransferase